MRKLFLIACLFPFLAHGQANYAQYVNPMIGTGGHGHTFPGATVPFGMVQLSPDTRIDGSWDGCSGYHHSDGYIYGFSHTHLSGTGCSDYGDILFVPFVGRASLAPESYKSKFSHSDETASAGFYSVKLASGITVSLTSTTRAGFHAYRFPASKQAGILIDLSHRDKTLESSLQIVGDRRVEGMRRSEAWARDQHVYFVAEFSKPFAHETFVDGKSQAKANWKDQPYSGKSVKTVLSFKTAKNETVYVKVGISTVSIEGARKNLGAEIPHWDFEQTKTEAIQAWNRELSKIEVSGGSKDRLTVFYTALYHCMIHPSTASDVDGQYRGRDNRIHKADGFTFYTVFSLWDTFRALHPLFTIIDRKRTNDFVQTFLAQYREAGILPVWELSSNETWCMIGYHSVSVMADAYAKGIRDFDARLALEAMQKSANLSYFGIGLYAQKGYLEKEDEHESVSKSLEYAYDDWCIATFAENLGEKAIADKYYSRAQSWRNLFDTEKKFIRPRSNGGWMEPFDPREVNNNYTEANAWQYTFFVPQDISGMIGAQGGPQAFGEKLDALFAADSKTTGREQSDITGLIGQYAHGNEPSHHMAYLYNYIGQPWKTQERIHQVETDFYKNAPDGLIGNEDCGQMSAWYVLSAMGFYPVCPGSTRYALGTPVFPKATIHLENGKTFTIEARGLDEKHFYLDRPEALFISHNDIMDGKTLVLNMSDRPSKDKTYEAAQLPATGIEKKFVPAPVFSGSGRVFRDSMKIELLLPGMPEGYELVYSFSEPGCSPDTCRIFPYTKPFYTRSGCRIWAWARDRVSGARSSWTCAYYHRIPHHWTVSIKGQYNPQYTAGGDQGIIDGIHGDKNWRKGGWQGYQTQDFECVVDLGEIKSFSKLHATFLQDQRAWIILPTEVEYSVSADGKNWTPYGSVPHTIDPKNEEVLIHDFSTTGGTTIRARYVKVKARNFGRLPDWHQGYGMGDAFIFVDEIWID